MQYRPGRTYAIKATTPVGGEPSRRSTTAGTNPSARGWPPTPSQHVPRGPHHELLDKEPKHSFGPVLCRSGRPRTLAPSHAARHPADSMYNSRFRDLTTTQQQVSQQAGGSISPASKRPVSQVRQPGYRACPCSASTHPGSLYLCGDRSSSIHIPWNLLLYRPLPAGTHCTRMIHKPLRRFSPYL